MDVIEKFLNEVSWKFDKGYPDITNEQDILMLERLLENEFGVILEGTLGKTGYKSQKQAASGPNAGKARINILIDKISKGEEIEFKSGNSPIEKVIVNKNKIKDLQNWDLNNSSEIKLTPKYSAGNVVKTQDFGGGGGGNRGGTSNTKTQESSQSLVNSLRQDKGVLSVDDLNNIGSLKKAFNNIEVDESLDKMIDFIQNSNWGGSLVGTANILASNFGTNYTQHRGSSFVDTIYKKYEELRKKDERIGQGRLGSDKWNPADIWMIKKGLEGDLLSLIEKTNNLDELNALLLQQYLDKNLIGVSLKKTDLSPNATEYNTTGLTQNIDYEYGGYSPLNFSTKSTFIFYDKNKNRIEFRSFPSFSGEIEGSGAAGGKIGITPLNIVFKNLGLPLLIDPKSVTNEDFINLWNKYSDQNLNEEKLKNILQDISSEKVRGKDFTKGEAGARDWLESRYFGLQVLDRINEAGSQKEKNQVIEDMLRYAASNNNWSSAFIKIS